MEPLWTPGADRIAQSNIAAIIRIVAERFDPSVTDYASLQRFSVRRPDLFWGLLWNWLGFVGERGTTVLENADDIRSARWFPEARLNFTENILREGSIDDRLALVGLTEDKPRREVTRAELHAQVSRLKQALEAAGIGPGDRVVSCMPNVPEAIVALLASAAVGAIWCACSPDYSEQALLDRIAQLDPKVLFVSDGYAYAGKVHDLRGKAAALVRQVPSLTHVIVTPQQEERPDLSSVPGAVLLPDFVAAYPAGPISYRRFPFDHPLFVFFSSGTTGKPKALMHHAGGHLISHLKDMVLQSDVKKGDRCFWPASTGWVVWVGYMPILAWDAVFIQYEGSLTYPDSHFLFETIARERAQRVRIPPPLIDRFMKEDLRPNEAHDLSSVLTVGAGGAPLLTKHFEYVYRHIGADLHLTSPAGGTDVNTTLISGDPTGPVYPGETQSPALGIAVDIFDDEGQPVRGRPGELVVTRPYPSMACGFWNDAGDTRFRETFFSTYPGIWRHGDWAEFTPRGRVVLRGRSDATLKVNGVRMGTADIYAALEDFAQIDEAVAVALETPRGDEIVLFVTMRDGQPCDKALQQSVRRAIRNRATARHVPAKVIAVPDIPRSANGKPSEIAVRDTIFGRAVNLSGLSNPEALEVFRAMDALGLAET